MPAFSHAWCRGSESNPFEGQREIASKQNLQHGCRRTCSTEVLGMTSTAMPSTVTVMVLGLHATGGVRWKADVTQGRS